MQTIIPTIFESIRIPIPQKAIYTRLGYRKGKTRILEQTGTIIQTYIEEAMDIITLKGSALNLKILKAHDNILELEGNTVFKSASLLKMLGDSKETLLMGATAGSDIMDEIKDEMSGKDMTRGIVLDAAASEIVDAALDWIMSFYNHELSRKNKRLTKRRFSAGYGDLALDNQQGFFHLLDMDRIGVHIVQESILVPEKSVTAIAGIVNL